MSYDKERWRFDKTSIISMHNQSMIGDLNKGSNNERSIKSTNNWFWHTSTNQDPYFKNTTNGAIIPKIINN